MFIRVLRRGFQGILLADIVWTLVSSRSLPLALGVAVCSTGGLWFGARIRQRGHLACQAARMLLFALTVVVAALFQVGSALEIAVLAYLAVACGMMISMSAGGGRRSWRTALRPGLAMPRLFTPSSAV